MTYGLTPRNRLALTPETKARQLAGSRRGGEERADQCREGLAFAARWRAEQRHKALLDSLYGPERQRLHFIPINPVELAFNGPAVVELSPFSAAAGNLVGGV